VSSAPSFAHGRRYRRTVRPDVDHADDASEPDGPLARFAQVWRRAPAGLRKTIISVIGGSLVLLGLALIVLPGPFTIPLLIAGFAILGTEFAWAASALAKVRRGLDRGVRIGKAIPGQVAKVVRRR